MGTAPSVLHGYAQFRAESGFTPPEQEVVRAAQVFLIGGSRRTLGLRGALTFAEVMFHHANLCPPRRLERVLGLFVVTARAHGVQHDSVAAHSTANSAAAWHHGIRLQGTRGPDLPQQPVVIGLPPQAD